MKKGEKGGKKVNTARVLERKTTGTQFYIETKNRKHIKPLYRPTPAEMKELNELTQRREGFEALCSIEREEE